MRRDPTRLGRDFKKRMRRGDMLVGGSLLEFARPALVKLYCQAGFDFLYVESEHVQFDPLSFTAMVQCARDNGLPVIAKTPQLERPSVCRLLDCGVTGIQLPRTESRRDLETLIGYMKFPPLGTRAGAPCWGNVDYAPPANHAQWLKNADQSVVVVAHIETAEGYRNAGEIISTPNLDMLYVGPYDFSISMGHPGEYDHPEVIGPMEEMLALCRKHNVPFGTSASGLASAKRWIKRGAQFFETADELSLILEGATKVMSDYRALIRKK